MMAGTCGGAPLLHSPCGRPCPGDASKRRMATKAFVPGALCEGHEGSPMLLW